MSRIFDALQRSETERLGILPENALSVATELVQSAEREVAKPAAEVANSVGGDFGPFQSLPISPPPDSRLICLTAKDSLGAEKFRFLGVRLRQLQQSRSLKKILITSTIPEEGKSTISGNLVATLARKQKQKVLLLDGDLRRPSLCHQFGLSKLPGLSEWLQGPPAPITNIYYLEAPGFWFLPSGYTPENPLELMQSGRLSELMDRLTAWFDWIVIDSPPVLPLADTTVWARVVDGILLVTREGTTQKKQLLRGLQVLEQSKLVGVVLNSSKNTDHTDYYQRYGPSTAASQSGIKQR